jgi:hypothetical protein
MAELIRRCMNLRIEKPQQAHDVSLLTSNVDLTDG